MSVPAYVSFGPGVNVASGITGLTANMPSSLLSGDYVIGILGVKNNAALVLTPEVSDAFATIVPRTVNGTDSFTIVGRVAAASDSALGFVFQFPSGNGRKGVMFHNFRGQSANWSFESVGVTTASPATTVLNDVGVITLGPDRIAVNVIAYSVSQAAQENFAGETGGTWTAGGFFSTQNPQFSLQYAQMPTADTIDGGSVAIANAPYVIAGFALSASPAVVGSAGGAGGVKSKGRRTRRRHVRPLWLRR